MGKIKAREYLLGGEAEPKPDLLWDCPRGWGCTSRSVDFAGKAWDGGQTQDEDSGTEIAADHG